MKLISYLQWRFDMIRYWSSISRELPIGGAMLEVGTWKGASAARWLKRLPRNMVVIDPYTRKQDNSWEGRKTQEELEEIAKKTNAYLVQQTRKNGNITHLENLRLTSLAGNALVKSGSLNVVYIDGDHSYAACLEDLTIWWPKLKPGGSLVVDDHQTGRWWGTDVIEAAKTFHPKDEEKRFSLGRWLIIQKTATPRNQAVCNCDVAADPNMEPVHWPGCDAVARVAKDGA